MTTFVIDAPLAIDLAGGGASIPPEQSLTAPTLLRSQALNGTAGRFSTISVGFGSGSSATAYCRITHGG